MYQLLVLALFLLEMDRSGLFFSYLPYLATQQSYNLVLLGSATAAHYFAETTGKIIAGRLVDRYGPALITISMLCTTCLLYLAWQTTSSALLIILALGSGAAVSFTWPGIISQVAPVEHPRRASRMGLVFTAWLGGNGAGLVGLNFWLEYLGGSSLTKLALLPALATICCWYYHKTARKKYPAPETVRPDLHITIRQMLGNRFFVRLILPGMFTQILTAGMLLPVLPVFASSNWHIAGANYSWLLICGGVAATLALYPFGCLADRIESRYQLCTGFWTTALVLLSLLVVKDIWSVFTLAALLGISYAAILPAWNNLLARLVPPGQQATGWGVFATVEGLGLSLGNLLGALTARFFTPSFTMLTAALLLATVGTTYYYTLAPATKTEGEPNEHEH
ncbi:MAG: MFS transporter [Bacillota bacterium]